MAKAALLLCTIALIAFDCAICLTQSQLNYLKQKLEEKYNMPDYSRNDIISILSEYSDYSYSSRSGEAEGEPMSIVQEGEHENYADENEDKNTTIKVDLRMPLIQPTYENEYFCHAMKMPKQRSVYIVGYEPKATEGTVHHMLLYGCSTPGSNNKVWNCGEMATNNDGPVCETGSRILYAWALEAPNFELPKDVGFEIGGDTGIQYLVLQVHYGKIAEKIKEHFTDDSGITLRITNQPMRLNAAVYLLGSDGSIPGHSEVHMESACRYKYPQVLHPFAFRVHTHKLGKVVSAYRIRDMQWTEIGRKDPQSPEMFYPTTKNITIQQGDVLAARCTMQNNLDTTVFIGLTSDDEMCNFYMMYYTANTLPDIDVCYKDERFHWRNHFHNIPADASVVPTVNTK